MGCKPPRNVVLGDTAEDLVIIVRDDQTANVVEVELIDDIVESAFGFDDRNKPTLPLDEELDAHGTLLIRDVTFPLKNWEPFQERAPKNVGRNTGVVKGGMLPDKGSAWGAYIQPRKTGPFFRRLSWGISKG
jgi:hypothetical protein